MKEKLEKFQSEMKDRAKAKVEKKAKKKLKKLLIRLACLALVCCAGVVAYKFRYQIAAKIINKKLEAQKLAAKEKCPLCFKLFEKK